MKKWMLTFLSNWRTDEERWWWHFRQSLLFYRLLSNAAREVTPIRKSSFFYQQLFDSPEKQIKVSTLFFNFPTVLIYLYNFVWNYVCRKLKERAETFSSLSVRVYTKKLVKAATFFSRVYLPQSSLENSLHPEMVSSRLPLKKYNTYSSGGGGIFF